MISNTRLEPINPANQLKIPWKAFLKPNIPIQNPDKPQMTINYSPITAQEDCNEHKSNFFPSNSGCHVAFITSQMLHVISPQNPHLAQIFSVRPQFHTIFPMENLV